MSPRPVTLMVSSIGGAGGGSGKRVSSRPDYQVGLPGSKAGSTPKQLLDPRQLIHPSVPASPSIKQEKVYRCFLIVLLGRFKQ